MAELDHDYTLHTGNKGDEALYTEFYVGSIENQDRSLAEGRPIFEDMEMVRIFTPGDRNNIVDRPVRPTDKHRFPKAYAAFKAGEGALQSGTPLAIWPVINKSTAAELAYFGIVTIEQLAGVSDGNTSKMPGLLDLKQKAAAFLVASKDTAAASKAIELQKSNDELLAQMAEMKAQIEALSQPKAATPAAVAKKPA